MHTSIQICVLSAMFDCEVCNIFGQQPPFTKHQIDAMSVPARPCLPAAPSCYKITQVGSITNLIKQPLPDPFPKPPPQHATIAVRAVGLNYADVFTCLGLYAASPRSDFIPGLELAGEIIDLNMEKEPAGDLQIGSRVMGVVRFGAYASHVHVPLHQLQPLPDAWSFQQGAAFLVQALTAIYGLRAQADIQSGARVLIQSAAGGVGLQAISICLALNATPVCIVGSAAKISTLTSRFPSLDPATQILVRADTGPAFAAQLDAIGGEFDIVFDAVGGPYFQPAYDRMAKGGRYVVYGAASMTPKGDRVGWLRLAWQYLQRPRVDVLSLPGANKAVMGFNLIYLFDRVEQLQRLCEELDALQLPPPLVGEEWRFEDQAVDALRSLQSGKTVGKVVLVL